MFKLNLSLCVIVNVSFIAAYTMVAGFILPLQQILLPNITDMVSLMFLPHGVRVLAIWLLGWRGALYLIPSAYLMWAISVFGIGVELDVWSPLVSIASVYAGIFLVRYIAGLPSQENSLYVSWRHCLLAGFVASLFNGFALSILIAGEVDWYLTAGYSFGDIIGQIVMMLLLILIMRVSRVANSLAQ